MRRAPAVRGRGSQDDQRAAEHTESTTPSLFDPVAVPDLDRGRRLRDDGQRTALHASDVRGTAAAMSAIRALAREGQPFTAETVRARVGTPLGGSDGAMGALFTRARAEGIIRHDGFAKATRPEARGRWIMTWIGAGAADG